MVRCWRVLLFLRQRAQRLQVHQILRAAGGRFRADEILEAQHANARAVNVDLDRARAMSS